MSQNWKHMIRTINKPVMMHLPIESDDDDSPQLSKLDMIWVHVKFRFFSLLLKLKIAQLETILYLQWRIPVIWKIIPFKTKMEVSAWLNHPKRKSRGGR